MIIVRKYTLSIEFILILSPMLLYFAVDMDDVDEVDGEFDVSKVSTGSFYLLYSQCICLHVVINVTSGSTMLIKCLFCVY